MSVFTCSSTPAGLRAPDLVRSRSVAPAMKTAKAPCDLSISELNSMAFGLAVYASQCGLLQHHARLASSCWSGSTGQAFHPHGSTERFQSCELHLILLSQACLAQRACHLLRSTYLARSHYTSGNNTHSNLRSSLLQSDCHSSNSPFLSL